MLLRKAYRDLTTRRLRSLLTLVGVLMGVAGLVAIVTTTQGFARVQRALYASGQRADLAIFVFDAPPSLLRTIEREPGVLAADLRVNHYGPGRLGAEGAWENLHFLGLRDFERQVTDRVELLEGSWPREGEALIEPVAMASRGLALGDTITIRDANNRSRTLRLSGSGRLPSALSADLTGLPLVFLPDGPALAMLDPPGYNELLIRFAPAADRAAVGARIEAELERRAIPKGRLRYSDPERFVGKRELDSLFVALYLFSGLGLLLAGFIVANTLAALVVESVREIGILKSLGATRAQVLVGILLAAGLYGLVGTAVGLGAGTLLGFTLLRLLGRVASLSPPFRIEPVAMLLGSGVGMGVTMLGGLVPAWQATRITPREALDSRGVSSDYGRSPLDRMLRRVAPLPPLPAMGLRNLLRRKGRSGVTVLVVALAVAALLAAQATDHSVATAIDEIFETYPADAYLQFGTPVDRADAGALRRVEGVERAEGWLLRSCAAGLATTRCWGIPADSPLYRPALVAGEWLDPTDPQGVVVSADLATAERLSPGAPLVVRYRGRERRLRVRGIVRDNAIFLGSEIQSKIFLPYRTLAPLTGDDGAVDLFAMTLTPPDLPGQRAILAEVDRKLAPLRPSSTLALAEFETSREPTRILTAALRAMVLLVSLVGGAGLVNTLALNVLERRREIGVLRVLGSDDRQLGALFVTEGLALGLLGWGAGLVVGWALGRLFVVALSASLFPIPYRFPAELALLSLLFALLLALVASVGPAFAAASIPTREAIQYE